MGSAAKIEPKAQFHTPEGQEGKDAKTAKDEQKAGTGFMLSLADAIRSLQKKGYTANLTPKYDHLEAELGKYKFYPQDFVIDEVVRFENTSDPDDQAILYAITASKAGVKGVYVESYGINQDEQSHDMIERLKQHPH